MVGTSCARSKVDLHVCVSKETKATGVNNGCDDQRSANQTAGVQNQFWRRANFASDEHFFSFLPRAQPKLL